MRRALAGLGPLVWLACGAPSGGGPETACRRPWSPEFVEGLAGRPLARLHAPRPGAREGPAASFAWTVMTLAADLRGTGSAAAADALRGLLLAWAEADALRELAERGPARNNREAVFILRQTLLPLLEAWEELRRAAPLPASESAAIDAWLARLVRRADVDTGPLATRHRPRDCARAPDRFDSQCNHERLLRDAVLLRWGLLIGDDALAERGVAGYRAALERMRPDGGLPGELGRGSRALWYTQRALCILVTMAQAGESRGLALYEVDMGGRSLHRAVAFFLDATEDPSRIREEASTNFDPGPRKDYTRPILLFLEPRPNGRHFMAWVELYAARFPDGENARRLRRLADGRLFGSDRPLVYELAGGNTTCRVETARR